MSDVPEKCSDIMFRDKEYAVGWLTLKILQNIDRYLIA
jgi:hypothetical protein